MSLQNLDALIKWMRQIGFKSIMLTGGEPTIHTRFDEVMRRIADARIKCYLTTNGTFEEQLQSAIAKTCSVVFMNVSLSDQEVARKLLHYHVPYLKKKGVRVILRVNIDTIDDQMSWVIFLAKYYGIRIRVGITNPALYAPQPFDANRTKQLIDKTRKFAELCEKEYVYVYCARPVPRCLFNDKEWRHMRKIMLIKARCFVGYRNNYLARLVVNPDLSAFGCFNNPRKIDYILSYENRRELNAFYAEHHKKVASSCILDLDNECAHFRNQTCYGSCLAYAQHLILGEQECQSH